jgi:hypothetical protein
MEPWSFLPEGYEPPLHGDQFKIVWRSDLGSNVSAAEVGDYLQAFQILLDLGERWGLAMAEEAAVRSLIRELFAHRDARGDIDLTPLRGVMSWQEEKRVYLSVQEVFTHRTGEHPETVVEVPSALRELASLSVPELMGPPVRIDAITYRSPLELAFIGGGFLAYGIIHVLRMTRDWRARRRLASAAADIAESEARKARTRADVIEYLGKEVTAGRLHVSPAELAELVTSTDLQAIADLAGQEPTLELPEGVSELFRGSDHKD